MKNKLQLAILCGGQSAEHEVSIISAKNVIQALDQNKYDIHIIFINKNGEWYLINSPSKFLNASNPQTLLATQYCDKVSLVLGQGRKCLMTLSNTPRWYELDATFPVLHGSHGEDGTMQGLFELANIPYVGPGVLGSAICMDKVISKRLLRAAKIPTTQWLTFNASEITQFNFEIISEQLGLPFFVKPANTGSSVGISKVKNKNAFNKAVDLAFTYDHKILFEQYIQGHEIECSVLGNETPDASLPGEIIPNHDFYSYEAKYLDPNGAALIVPAKFPKKVITKIQTMAKKTFTALCCEGMARVDFFVTPNYKIFVNEANTIPGFTSISMYPKLWIASGVPYSDLLDRLIQLAITRFKRDRVLVTARSKPGK